MQINWTTIITTCAAIAGIVALAKLGHYDVALYGSIIALAGAAQMKKAVRKTTERKGDTIPAPPVFSDAADSAPTPVTKVEVPLPHLLQKDSDK